MQFPAEFPAEFPRPMPFVGDPIAAMFPAGTVRGNYDSARLDALYLDTAMTQPLSALGSYAAALGSPVAAIRDQWGGPALVQPVDTKRALFGRHPPQIRQRLANSAFVGAASGTPGATPTGWAWQSSTGTLVSTGDGTLTFSGTAARQIMGVAPTLAASGTNTFSAKVVANPNSLALNQLILALNGPTGVSLAYYANGASVNSNSYVPSAGDLISVVMTTTGTAGSITLRLGLGCSSAATGSVTLSEPQFEAGSSRTAYQRSAGIHDITETGQPDIWGLRFDGTDDAYSSASPISLGTDEVCILASAYKMSDAATGMLAELSASIAANNGTLQLTAPQSAAATYGFASKGTAQSSATSAASYAAPHGAIMTGQGKIASDLATLRINGTQVATSATDQGTGTYTSQTIYVGGRAGTSLFYNGWDHGLIYGGRIPDAAVLQRAERYLGAKSRITVA